jgi:predicted RNA-binding protein with PUA-like domain
MAMFIFKTEPSEFSFDDLVAAGTSVWDGVSNAQALGNLRRASSGDEVLVYETGTRKAIVGLARVVGSPFEDPDQPGVTASGEPKRPVVSLRAAGPVPRQVSLESIKADARFAEFALVRQPRLSVILVPEETAAQLRELCGLDEANPPAKSKRPRT